MKRILTIAALMALYATSRARETYNFNCGWIIGNDKNVTLPHAWNEDEAFRIPLPMTGDSVVWYHKTFTLPESAKGQRIIIEFEGVRTAAEVTVNGHKAGLHENGVTAFGLDITDFLKTGRNRIDVMTDNDWNYKERSTGTKYQWQSKNFYSNYGGINKNVKLHIVPQIHQTLPLYSNLGTTGQYIYATDFDINGHKATIHAETQVRNTTAGSVKAEYNVILCEYDGTEVARFSGGTATIAPNSTATLKASRNIGGLHFWSWGYGYLYKVRTVVRTTDGQGMKYEDEVETVTGFRKTSFTNGYLRLNDRGMMMHGYAQRSTNEWPGVGCAVPPWLSDYSNNLLVKSGGNLVRWMHVTPSKQDIESCDRVGLIQAMPAADAEYDTKGRQWEQRTEVMRDAIIYNRNNPSVIFIESGNHGITEEHMAEMKAIRNLYDPHGGRAIGSRDMLDSRTAEYGGEMLYMNKSDTKPMWMMEYCRDEGLRLYWNQWCYPYHAEGAGPLYRNGSSKSYNHNQDKFAEELVRRWYDSWLERPGQGTMVAGGGAKIIFSDTQTHCRGEENYRRSGVVDPMRIEKDAFFVHRVMWDGWVDDLRPHTHIIGHWTYDTEDVRTKTEQKDPDAQKAKFILPEIKVVSNSEIVKLFVNGKELDRKAKRSANFMFTFTGVTYERGTLTAVGYDKDGHEESRHTLTSAGKAERIVLTPITNPAGWRADGADVALVQVEVVDAEGRRCPVDNSMIHFTLKGNAEWRGGLAKGKDNYVLRQSLPVECGVNRVMLRSTPKAGKVILAATAEGLQGAVAELRTTPFDGKGGLSATMPDDGLPLVLNRRETPAEPSFVQHAVDVPIAKVSAGSNTASAANVADKNETTSWESDGTPQGNRITLWLEQSETVDEISFRMGNANSISYPLIVYADSTEVFRGSTKTSMGYTRIKLKPVKASTITIHSGGKSRKNGQIAELVEVDPNVTERKADPSTCLRIIEMQLIHRLH